MKNLILFFCIFLFFISPVFAEDMKIPKNLSIQYKKEIEKIIDSEYNNIIKDIDNNVKEAKFLRDKLLKYGFNIEDYIKLSLIPETNIPSADLDLYAKLLQLTYEKYIEISYKPIGTDSSFVLDELLSDYFKDNNIDKGKLKKIIFYENKKINLGKKYVKQVEKMYIPNNQDI